MGFKFLIALLLIAILAFGAYKQSSNLKPYHNEEVIKSAYKLIKKYHSEAEHPNNVIKVVYFHGKDMEPLLNWRERLTRTLDDVSNFYKEEFYKYGIETEGIPFEKLDGKYVFHVIQGDSASRSYSSASGSKIQNEIYKKTLEVDFSKDHILIINGLSYKKPDGTYVFHSPYYGTGSSVNGLCHVADCELLDSKMLKDTTQGMIFSEMMVSLKKCSVAEFNSWYIGGIAHEMGHMFGLPHDFGNPLELDTSSLSLMGEYGSRHFRDYLWSGKKSSVFSSASILQLISHPVFTQSNRFRNKIPTLILSNLIFNRNNSGLVLKATIKADELPYGVVALIHPSYLSEYYNRSYSKLITTNDSVSFELGLLSKGNYALQLLFVFPNGAVKTFNKVFSKDSTGNVVVFDSNNGIVNIKEFYEKLLQMENTPAIQRKLNILQDILNPSTPIDPKIYTGSKLFLSDAKWEKASVGWEKVARNYFTCESEFTFFLENQGELFSNGLYAHSPSSYVFNLDKKWKSFSAVVGLRDYAHEQGSARFTVVGDGKVLYETAALRKNQQNIFSVDISNIKILELKADGTEGHCHNSWAVWLNPMLER